MRGRYTLAQAERLEEILGRDLRRPLSRAEKLRRYRWRRWSSLRASNFVAPICYPRLAKFGRFVAFCGVLEIAWRDNTPE